MYSHSKVNQDVKVMTAALVKVTTTGVTLVHESSQHPQGIIWLVVTDGLELRDPLRLAVHMQGSVVKLETIH